MYSPETIRKNLKTWKATKLQGKYQILESIGQGTFGKVYKAKFDDKYFALKKFVQKNESFGISPHSLRQIKIIRDLSHENIIQFIEVCQGFDINTKKKETFVALELADTDFKKITQEKKEFTDSQIKCIIYQLLQGVHYIHSKNIVHRDLKNNNILYKNTGEVKIADFGCATYHTEKNEKLKWSNVQNISYRAPEIIFQFDYNQKIDIWSIGVIASKLIFKQFFGKFKESQDKLDMKIFLEQFFKFYGTPSQQDWPQIYTQKKELKQKYFPQKTYKKTFINALRMKKPKIDSDLFDLLDKMLCLNPEKRISAKEALEHNYFKNFPPMAQLHQMPKFMSRNNINQVKETIALNKEIKQIINISQKVEEQCKQVQVYEQKKIQQISQRKKNVQLEINKISKQAFYKEYMSRIPKKKQNIKKKIQFKKKQQQNNIQQKHYYSNHFQFDINIIKILSPLNRQASPSKSLSQFLFESSFTINQCIQNQSQSRINQLQKNQFLINQILNE